MNQLTFKAKVVDVFDGYGDGTVRTHLTCPEGFLLLHKQDSLVLSIGQEVEITIAPLHEVSVTCEHEEQVESDGTGSDTDAHVGDGAQPENSPASVWPCNHCADGRPRSRETLPDGEVIWGHWESGKSGSVFHQCPNDSE